ncbi:hypothetical protein FHS21_001317 [Phyllobacterium trifolii]|uniref:Uncharacterized protein n=1 Tax=Phyllobacterium trifolii TaxID=300193 RepID=A0A839U1S2_9HYPH|nr:hypothetical protein [Phyllobacterium trifolii]
MSAQGAITAARAAQGTLDPNQQARQIALALEELARAVQQLQNDVASLKRR